MQATTPINVRKVRDVGDVLNVTFQFIRQNAMPLGKAILYIGGPAVVISTIIGAIWQIFFLQSISGEALTDPLSGAYWTFMGGTMGYAVLISTPLSLVGMVVVYGYLKIYPTHGSQPIEVSDVWAVTRQYFFRILGITYAIFLLMGLGFLINIIPCAGSIVFLGGMIYMLVVWSIMYPMYFVEDIGFTAAMKRSRTLIKGHFWESFAVLFIAWVVMAILMMLIYIPAIVLGVFQGVFAVDIGALPTYNVSTALFGLIGGIGMTMLYAIPIVAATFQYFSLVEQKDRVGLRERVERIDQTDTPVAPDQAEEEPPKTADPSPEQ